MLYEVITFNVGSEIVQTFNVFASELFRDKTGRGYNSKNERTGKCTAVYYRLWFDAFSRFILSGRFRRSHVFVQPRITSYNVCYTKLLRLFPFRQWFQQEMTDYLRSLHIYLPAYFSEAG